MDDSRIKAASDIVRSLFNEGDLASKAKAANEILGEWKNVAGDRLAAHTWISDIRDGVLWIEADHPGWIQMLSIQEYRILKKYQRIHPELKLRAISAFVGKRARDTASVSPARSQEGRTKGEAPTHAASTTKPIQEADLPESALIDQLARLGSLLDARRGNH
jgi:hypothetical protein